MDNPTDKYSAYKPVDLDNREWPSKLIKKAPKCTKFSTAMQSFLKKTSLMESFPNLQFLHT